MRFLIPMLFVLSACSPIFKLSTSQGNAIENDKLAQVEPGMTREQVRYLLGSPLVVDEFQPNRWDYVSYFRSGSGVERQRVVSLYFDGEQLTRIDDSHPPAATAPADDEDGAAAEENAAEQDEA